jgi:hypothetical protein
MTDLGGRYEILPNFQKPISQTWRIMDLETRKEYMLYNVTNPYFVNIDPPLNVSEDSIWIWPRRKITISGTFTFDYWTELGEKK